MYKSLLSYLSHFFDQDTQEFLGHAKNYLSVNVILSTVSFLLIPITTSLLTPEDYGILAIFTSIVSIFSLIFLLSIDSAIKVNYLKKDFPHASYLYSNLLFLIISNIITLGIIILFSKQIGEYFNIQQSIIILATIVAICTIFIQIKLNLLQAQKNSSKYSIFALSKGLSISIIGVIVMMFLSSNHYWGPILTNLLISVIFALYFIKLLFQETNWSFNFSFVKNALSFGIPLLPHALSGFILTFFDRIIINQLVGSSKTGLYSFAYQIGMVMNMVVASMNQAWQPIYWDLIRKKSWQKINNIAYKYAKYIYFAAITLILFSREIIIIIADPKYLEAIAIVPIIIFSYVIIFLYTLFSGIIFYHKKTGLISLTTLLAATLNIYLNYHFIPQYGYIAAAWTTLASYIFLLLANYINSRFILKYSKLELMAVFPDLIFLLFIFVIHFFLASSSSTFWQLLIIKIILFVISFLYLFKWFNKKYGY